MRIVIMAAAIVAAVVAGASSEAGAVDAYGAIAYAPDTKASAGAYDFGSQEEAEQAALAECGKQSEGCQAAIWFKNSCGAIGDGGWGASWGDDQPKAELSAVEQCSKFTTNCKVERSLCNSQ